jgi:hypothetical protein
VSVKLPPVTLRQPPSSNFDVSLIVSVAEPNATVPTARPSPPAAPSVQYRRRWAVVPAGRVPVTVCQPSDVPVMPLPKFWPFGLSFDDADVSRCFQAPSTLASR